MVVSTHDLCQVLESLESVMKELAFVLQRSIGASTGMLSLS